MTTKNIKYVVQLQLHLENKRQEKKDFGSGRDMDTRSILNKLSKTKNKKTRRPEQHQNLKDTTKEQVNKCLNYQIELLASL